MVVETSVVCAAHVFELVADASRVCLGAGDGRERQRRAVYCAGRRTADGSFRKRREHNPRCEYERQHHQQGTYFIVASFLLLLLRQEMIRVCIMTLRPLRRRRTHMGTYPSLTPSLSGCDPFIHTGPRLGVIQHVEVCRAANGSQHGLRAWAPKDPCKLCLPRFVIFKHERVAT